MQGEYKLTRNGKYSISASYIVMLGDQRRLRTVELIWSSILLPQHRFITWLVVQGRLLTKVRLQRLHIQVETIDCCICKTQEPET